MNTFSGMNDLNCTRIPFSLLTFANKFGNDQIELNVMGFGMARHMIAA